MATQQFVDTVVPMPWLGTKLTEQIELLVAIQVTMVVVEPTVLMVPRQPQEAVAPTTGAVLQPEAIHLPIIIRVEAPEVTSPLAVRHQDLVTITDLPVFQEVLERTEAAEEILPEVQVAIEARAEVVQEVQAA